MTLLRRAIAFLIGFLQEHTASSSARLAGLSLCWTGCWVAKRAVDFAFLHPDRVGSLATFATIIGALVLRQFPTVQDITGIILVVLGVALHQED